MWGQFVRAVGFDDGKGGVSFNKMVTFTALWAFIGAVFVIIRELRQVPPLAVWSFGLACVSAGFGFKGLNAFLATRRENLTQTDTSSVQLTGDLTEITKAVLAKRDAARGIDPA